MTDFADLTMRIDSTQVKQGTAELDKLTAAGTKTEASTKGVEREWVKASSTAGKLRLEESRLALESDKLSRSQKNVGATASEMAREAQRASGALKSTAASAGAMRAGSQQLAFQLSDVATQFSLGARPMQIFGAQAGQIVGALSLMRGTAGGLVGFLAGPWGIALTAAATVVGTLVFSMNDAEEQTNAFNDALRETKTAADLAAAALQRLESIRGSSLANDIALNSVELEKRRVELRRLEGVEARFQASGLGSSFGESAGGPRIRELRGEIARLEVAVEDGTLALNNLGKENERAAASSRKSSKSVSEQTKALREQAKVLDELLGRLLKPERDQAQRNSEFDLLAREIEKAEAAGVSALPRLLELEKALERLRGEGITQGGRLTVNARDPGSLLKDIPDLAQEAADAVVSGFERQENAARALNQAINETIFLLGDLGGVGSVLGTLLGVATGQVGAINGPIGALLNSTIGLNDDGSARRVADELRDIFKLEGEFGQTMQRLLQGAGAGVLAANVLGLNSGASQIGGALGGALGNQFSESVSKAIGGTLGNVAGAFLPVLGGVLGGLAGSLFGSTPRGSATIGGVGGALGVTGTRGSSNARIAAATDSANAIIGSLEALALELGATLDPSRGSVSIGIRKNNFRVDTSGQGRTKTSKGAIDFGQDAEAAALFAIQDLIRDGVLVGLRKGTENLLKNAADLETGIQKALAFEGVFTSLEALQDPLGAALSNIEKEFDRLRKIFDEAGATAAEYAQLEELLNLRRQEAIDEGARRELDKLSQRNDLEVQLLQLLGREQEALNLAREYELATIESSLRPLQQMVFQLQDAQTVIAQFEPLADDLRRFREEIQGGDARDSFGFVSARFQNTAAAAAQGDVDALSNLRSASTEFLAAAKDNASSAVEYQRAVGQVLGAVDQGIFAADTQIDYAKLQIEAIDANREEILKMKDLLAAQQQTLVENSNAMRRMWERFEGDGLTIKSDEDTPVYVRTGTGYTVETS